VSDCSSEERLLFAVSKSSCELQVSYDWFAVVHAEEFCIVSDGSFSVEVGNLTH
jgi:hypothetical protein